jgi:serine/threonine-protein kinase
MAELKKLGRYELRRVLGKGAMGVVYEGFDPTLSRRVAVKTILKSVALDDETERAYGERFVREAKAVARLNHPHIVQVFDFGMENEAAYLVMEFIQGQELRDLFAGGERFEAGECVRIMGELLDALDFAHEAGVIHRDVKPANVMLDAQRRVKLADFGVARVQDSDRSAAGTMVGTPAFMSPEQIQGGKIDRRTDIFSAGTILYQLLTGEQPFKGEGAWTVAKQIMQDEPPSPSTVVKSVSPAFDAIVEKALAKSPAQRFATAREFAAALRGTLSGAAVVAPKPKSKAESKASEAEVEFWRAIQNSADPAEFEFYLEQFPDGTYAALARHKIAKLKGASPAEDTVRLEAEAAAKRRAEEEKARQEAEARARQDAEKAAQRAAQEKARREAAEQAKREAEEKARREAQERAQREAEAAAKRVAEEKARREAQERAKREAEEKARQAALARLKQQEAARAKAAADEDSTVALPPPRELAAAAASAPAEKTRSLAIPAVIAVVAVAGGIAAYLFTGRTPAPAPVAETATPKPAAAPAAPAVDLEKIRREAEERVRREYAEKAAAERAALEKSVAEKVAAEAAAAKKVAEAKSAAEKAAAEKAAAAAVAARQAAEKAAAEKAAAAKAAENAAVQKAAAERVAAEKASAEKAATERAATEKAAAEKAAAEKAAAEKQAAAAGSQDALLERFIQRVGRDKVLKQEPPRSTVMTVSDVLAPGQVVYVDDGWCPPGRIREVTGTPDALGSNLRDRPSRCISLADDRATPARASAAKVAAAAPAPASVAADGDALERFIQRVGREKVLNTEPALSTGSSCFGRVHPCGAVLYVNDGSCGSGAIKEITIENPGRNTDRLSRCISLADSKPVAVKPSAPRQATLSPKPAPTAPSASGDADARLERFIQRVGRNKVLKEEPPFPANAYYASPLQPREIVYINDGSCGPGRIKEITGVNTAMGSSTRLMSWPSRCIPLE